MSKLQFQQACPGGFDSFNGRPSLPVSISRVEAAEGLRRLRRGRRHVRIVRDGSHRYTLIGLNTVILEPVPLVAQPCT